MALKKSDLYSSLWASCDELRGGMDASQYKGYVLFLLFIKYITDEHGNSTDFAPPVTIPRAALLQRPARLKTPATTARASVRHSYTTSRDVTAARAMRACPAATFLPT